MNPYKLGAVALAVALLLGLIYSAGRKGGIEAERKTHAPAHAKLEAAYKEAHTGLLQAGVALRELSARAREDAARAAQQQAQGQAQASQAKAETQAMRNRVQTLDRQLQAERSGCREAEAQICGVPLR